MDKLYRYQTRFINSLREISFVLSVSLLTASLAINILITIRLFQSNYSHLLILLWILSILLFLISTVEPIKLKTDNLHLSKRLILYLTVIILPSMVRIANFNLDRIHGDDLITAYFSAHYNFDNINFFSAIPQDKGQWVSQFPTIFFILQKIFFLVFGESLLSVKFSIIPYVLLVSLMLFLITKAIFETKTALITLILYAFFAISLYHETLGLHFIASTAVFLVFFYLVLINFKQNKPSLSRQAGIFCGLCYLFYSSSYVAFPLLVLISIIQFLWYKKLSIIYNFILAVVGFLIVLGPFLIYTHKDNNYFLQRINQVSLLTGSWSGAPERIKKGEKPLLIVKENLVIAIKSFYQNGIGGHGGYEFGRLALLEKFNLYLFIAGLMLGLLLLWRKIELLLVFLIIVISFVTGIVLTIPPPAYHRFSLAFPFLVLITTLPFHLFLSIKKTKTLPSARTLIPAELSNRIKYVIIIVFLTIYIFNNQIYFQQSVKNENNNELLKLSKYINRNFPHRNVYVASFPSFAFEKIFYFSPGKTVNEIQTDYHDTFLKMFNPAEKYVYVIIFPDAFGKKFAQLDKNGRLINFSEYTSLFVN